MVATDLFGRPVDLEALARAPLVGRKKRMEPIPSGHAATKGTGPEGETCGSCRHIVRKRLAKTYIKCGKNREGWTGGRKSDVRAKDAACKFWEAPTPSERE